MRLATEPGRQEDRSSGDIQIHIELTGYKRASGARLHSGFAGRADVHADARLRELLELLQQRFSLLRQPRLQLPDLQQRTAVSAPAWPGRSKCR